MRATRARAIFKSLVRAPRHSGGLPPDRAGLFSRLPVRVLVGLAVVVAALLVPFLLDSEADESSAGALHQALAPGRALVSLSGARPVPIPRSFLGLSTEYWVVPVWDRQLAALQHVVSDLRVPGDGPFILRIGGDSADQSLWQPKMRKIPDWVFALDPGWLKAASAVTRTTRSKLILDLNLLTTTPPIAAQWARIAQSALPERSVIGLEVGNEPDIYNRRYWMGLTAGTTATDVLPRTLTAADYARDFETYARVLSPAAPGIPLVGPAVANPTRHLSFITTLLARSHPGLETVSAHRYPYSACTRPWSRAYPTIGRILSSHATTGMADALMPAINSALRAGLEIRLTELNSVTCGGRDGVSNTFATALWAPDALFELASRHVAGVNIHVPRHTFNAAFIMTGTGVSARPLLYGLILFARTLGPDAELLDTRVHGVRASGLKVWAVRVRGGGLHVLLINKGRRPIRATLALPGRGPAVVERLLAPAVRAEAGVTWNGQHLSASGTWVGRPATRTVAASRRGYRMIVPAYSAALLQIGPRRTRAAGRRARRARV